MKKLLLTCALGTLLSLPVMAASQQCAYTPRQTLIRDAVDANKISELIAQGVNFDETPRCGGSLMQLAIRRGNTAVLAALLNQDLKRVSQEAVLDEFPIPGAPKKIPLWLFAAYYAPNADTVILMHQALLKVGGRMDMTDSAGRNVLWYMDRNPVLRKTELYEQLNGQLLTSLSNPQDLLLNEALANNAGATGASNAAPKVQGNVQPLQLSNTLSLPTLGDSNQKVVLEPTK